MIMYKARDGNLYPTSGRKTLWPSNWSQDEEKYVLMKWELEVPREEFTERELEVLDAWTWRACMEGVLRELRGRPHTDFFPLLDTLHTGAVHRNCGCVDHFVFHHWDAQMGKEVSHFPNRVGKTCEKHASVAHDPASHYYAAWADSFKQ